MRRFRLFVVVLGCAIASAVLAAGEEDEDLVKGREAYYKGDIVGSMPQLRKAAEKGIAEAQYLYGYATSVSGFEEDGYSYVQKAAEQGYVDAMLELAAMKERGIGTAAKPMEARAILLDLATKGEVRAVIAIATAYLEGRLGLSETELGSPEALGWIQRAADAGDIRSLKRLLETYKKGGYGLAPDAAKADSIQKRINEIQPPKVEKRTRRTR